MDNVEIEDFFSGLGAVTIRRLFAGKAVYSEGLIVGIVRRDGELLLKADDETAPKFEAAGGARWGRVDKRGKTVLMPYWTVPAEAFDDPERMAVWVRLAAAAARRAGGHG